MFHIDSEIILVISITSDNKLKDGGAAILIDKIRNHSMDILGRNSIIPFVKYLLRVLVIKYDILANENKAEEHKPCAIIINIAPAIPHKEKVIIPATIIPMCPIDE